MKPVVSQVEKHFTEKHIKYHQKSPKIMKSLEQKITKNSQK